MLSPREAEDEAVYRSPDQLLPGARALIDGAALLLAATRPSVAPIDLISLQGRLLRALAQRGWASVTVLAEMADVSAMAISKAVTSLERKGLVARRPHPDGDARRRIVAITDSGAILVNDLTTARAQEAAYVLSHVPPAQQKVLELAGPLLAARAADIAQVRRSQRGVVGRRWL